MTLTTPQGFRAAGVAAGLKSTGALDLALVVNDGPAHAAAGVFTRNKVKAAPVLWSQQVLTTGRLRAVVLNSGGANACTGPEGFQTAHATAEKAAEALGCAPVEVAVCSTGLIGKQLPREAVLAGVEAAAAALGAGLIRDDTGSYHYAFLLAGALCMGASLAVARIRRPAVVQPAPAAGLV